VLASALGNGSGSRGSNAKAAKVTGCGFTTGAMRVEPDRRHLTLPVIGTVRTHENTRRIERLIRAGRARGASDLSAPATALVWTRACGCLFNDPSIPASR